MINNQFALSKSNTIRCLHRNSGHARSTHCYIRTPPSLPSTLNQALRLTDVSTGQLTARRSHPSSHSRPEKGGRWAGPGAWVPPPSLVERKLQSSCCRLQIAAAAAAAAAGGEGSILRVLHILQETPPC